MVRIFGSFLVCLAAALLASPVVAQETEAPAEEAPESEESLTEDTEETEDEDEEEDEVRESADGSYEWKPSWGVGLEAGFWFMGMERWNAQLIEPNGETPFDQTGLWHFDLFVEASLLENTRISLFGGFQTPFGDNPSLSAWYVGLEPAFAFRRDMWEVALGVGVGFGAVSNEYQSGNSLDASLVLMRPFLEVRRYLTDWMGVYGRFGFNQWLISDPELDGLLFTVAGDESSVGVNPDNLNEGGPFLALGVRFGSYPEHVREIGDTDGDGLLDDIDECPEDPEDFDNFEDTDGCPDLDNDNDGILDVDDKCPDVAGIAELGGCPAEDTDGDGISNHLDKCPDVAGVAELEGCPILDGDNDGIPDHKDKCPEKAGVPEKEGCPFYRVQVTMAKIEILDKVFFDLDKATIKEESFSLLDEVAATINAYPRIKLIEVQGHTDHAGRAAYNKDLSARRAQSVVDYLISKGVQTDRLVAKGYGMEQPLVPLPENGKETPEGAEKNRRVEFVILEQEEVTKEVPENELPAEEKIENVEPVEGEPTEGESAE